MRYTTLKKDVQNAYLGYFDKIFKETVFKRNST